MDIYIYGLFDPAEGMLRYIGKTTKQPKVRLREHIKQAKGDRKSDKDIWILSLLDIGKKPTIEILDIIDEDSWEEAEKSWIANFDNLLNVCNGGSNPPDWTDVKQSDEHIQKRVKTRIKKNNYSHTEETKRLISKNRKGKNLGNTHTLGHRHTEETKQKMSEVHAGSRNHFYGKSHSEESRRKISQSRKGKCLGNSFGFSTGHQPWNKGKKHSEQTKRKVSENNKSGTPEVKKKISESMKAKWQDPEYRAMMLKSFKSANKGE